MKIKTILLEHFKGLGLPNRATEGSAGLDLRAAISEDVVIKKGSFKLLPTGIIVEIPEGYEAQIRPRSGLAAKHGLTVLNTPGTIDSDYRGEVKIILINLGEEDYVIKRGERIAQMVVSKYEKIQLVESKSLSATNRSNSGFGSSGIS